MGIIARQSIKGAIANYIGVAIGFFVSFFVLTKYLTQEEIGLTRVLVDAAMLFSSLSMLGTNASMVRFFPWFKDESRGNHGIFGLSVLVPLTGFVLFALAFLLFKEPLLEIYGEKSPLLADYFMLVPMLTFFALYMTVFETGASVLMRITVPKMVREVGVRLFNLAAYLLYGFHVISLDAFVWMFCGSYGLAMVLNLVYLVKLGHVSFRIDRGFLGLQGNRQKAGAPKVGEMVRYTLFMTATVLAGNIPLINSLFLGAQAGLALTGVYTIASYIANVVEVPYRSLGAISRPVISTAVKEDNWGEVNRLARQVSVHQLMVSLLIFYVIWINIDALFAVIPNGADYAGGAVVVFVLGLAKVVNSSLSVGTDILNFSRHYTISLPLIAVLTTTAIVLNNLFISRMGIGGAACATLCAYGLYFVLLGSYLWWRLRVNVLTRGHLKMVLLTAALLGLNWLWKVDSEGVAAIIGWAAAKTVVLGGVAVTAVFLLRISPTVNELIVKIGKPRKP